MLDVFAGFYFLNVAVGIEISNDLVLLCVFADTVGVVTSSGHVLTSSGHVVTSSGHASSSVCH